MEKRGTKNRATHITSFVSFVFFALIQVAVAEHHEEEIRRHIGDLLASVKDAQFTGRSVARIFQGIPSPCFPSEDWARNRSFWRKHIDLDFHYLCKIASQEILRF